MHMKDDIRPVTYLKSKASDLLKQVNETHRPVVITQNGMAKAVLQDTQSYEDMRNTIGLLKLISSGEADARSGAVKTQDQVFESIDKMLDDL